MPYLTLTKENIDLQHICCAFSDKKLAESYKLKKKWLTGEFGNGYVFRKLDERAKVFIEYGPAEMAWVPMTAPNYMMMGCFWVSGKHKGNGHGKALLQEAIDAAGSMGKDGLVAVVGTKKYHFMSDTKWLLGQGFELCESIPAGFSLISLEFGSSKSRPRFNDCVKCGEAPEKSGCVVYYSNRCPYAEYYVKESLISTCEKRGIKLKAIKLETRDQAQSAPTPATIFSLFLNSKFVTTDISVCMDNRFDKIVGK